MAVANTGGFSRIEEGTKEQQLCKHLKTHRRTRGTDKLLLILMHCLMIYPMASVYRP